MFVEGVFLRVDELIFSFYRYSLAKNAAAFPGILAPCAAHGFPSPVREAGHVPRSSTAVPRRRAPADTRSPNSAASARWFPTPSPSTGWPAILRRSYERPTLYIPV